jgi:hypothetical protein
MSTNELPLDFVSQRGQDSVIFDLLNQIDPSWKTRVDKPWGVEFGAWDGVFASNLKYFHDNHSWHIVWIEPDRGRFESLRANYANSRSAILIKSFVNPKGEKSLDSLLSSTPAPKDFDVLSIDIDGNDFHVWNGLQGYQPKIVVIEFNPTIPLWMNYVQEFNSRDHEQCSLKSIVELANSKGYEFVHTNGNDAFFVRSEYFPKINISDNSIETLFQPFLLNWQTWLWQTTSGKLRIAGNNELKWHNLYIREERIQILPKILQFFPGKTSKPLQFAKYLFYKSSLLRKIYSVIVTGRAKHPEVNSSTDHLTY